MYDMPHPVRYDHEGRSGANWGPTLLGAVGWVVFAVIGATWFSSMVDGLDIAAW